MHLCFSRKNKTLSAIFKQKNVLELFEQNYKTFCSLNNQPVDASFDAHKVVVAILERTGSAEKRSAKMDIDDFLRCAFFTHAHTYTHIPPDDSLIADCSRRSTRLIFTSHNFFATPHCGRANTRTLLSAPGGEQVRCLSSQFFSEPKCQPQTSAFVDVHSVNGIVTPERPRRRCRNVAKLGKLYLASPIVSSSYSRQLLPHFSDTDVR